MKILFFFCKICFALHFKACKYISQTIELYIIETSYLLNNDFKIFNLKKKMFEVFDIWYDKL